VIVSTTVTLEEGEEFALSADEVALAVLEALGGDAATDYAEAHVRTGALGAAGEHPGVGQAAAMNAELQERVAEVTEDPEHWGKGLAHDDAVANDDAPEPEA
jgi:hypothetical protein